MTNITLRLDRAVRPAGLIRSMKTYSVIIAENQLFLICVGPAMRGVRATNPIAGAAINYLANSYEKKILDNEREIDSQPLDQLSQRKENFSAPLEEITAVVLKKDFTGFPVLSFTIGTQKMKLQFRQQTFEDVQKLVDHLIIK